MRIRNSIEFDKLFKLFSINLHFSREDLAKELDRMVTCRNIHVHCTIDVQDERVLALKALFDRRSSLQVTFFHEHTLLQNYLKLKQEFPDRFRDL